MYTRSYPEKEKIQIPQNYGGNAFREDIYKGMDDIQHEASPEPTISPPKVQDIPRLPSPKQTESSSVLSSILPNLLQKNHFPFGHGIGSEELFILGIMLLIYMSGDEGEIDSELLLLLCILLFSG